MNKHASNFRRRLRTLRRQWQGGLFLRLLLRLGGWALMLLVLYLIADYFLALPMMARLSLNGVVLGILGFVFVSGLAAILRRTDRDAAKRADRLLASPRRSTLSALELSRTLDQSRGSGLQQYLVARDIDAAVNALKPLTPARNFPKPECLRQCRILGVQLLLAALVAGTQWTAAAVILQRILHPGRDIPPYSRLRFAVTPERPNVLYGGKAEISAAITGGPVTETVWLRTRRDGQVHQAACFQDGEGRYTQRLEKLVAPIEFCFATGNARSRWHRVALRYQPEIAVASARITPPAYARKEPRTVFIGSEEFAPRQGAAVALTITSNRPLLDGVLTLQQKGYQGDIRSVKGVRVDNRMVRFEWTARAPATVRATIRDVHGTENRTPLVFEQQITVDRKPDITITQPGSFLLATPTVTVPIRGYIRDDLGLQRIDLIRCLVGYRDRTKGVANGDLPRRLELQEDLNLGTVGAMPGQVLELYVEAADHNPDLTGTAASDIIRVQVISEEDYAEIIRARTTINEFVQRYEMAARQLQALRQALEAVKQAADKNDRDTLAKRLRQAQAEARKAEKLFNSLGRDFPAFEAEKELSQLLQAIGKSARHCALQIEEKKESPSPVLLELMQELMDMLAPQQQKLEDQKNQARRMAAIGRLIECAGRFSVLYRRQADLVRRLARHTGLGANDALLRNLEKHQADIRRELQKLQRDIRERAKDLADEFSELRDSALAFADKITELKIPDAMTDAESACRNTDGKQAHHNAVLAKERMEQLMQDSCQSPFGGFCDGKLRFSVPKNMKKTLEQLIRALGRRLGGYGSGLGLGAGTGSGQEQSGGGGSAGMGSSLLDTPVLGPPRLQFAGRGSGSGRGKGSGSGKGQTGGVVDQGEVMDIDRKSDVGSRSMPLQRVPQKYLEAVKRYFAEETE